ncbi:MAG TPA: hypothetical protein VIH99_12480 [Bdellovibrionota bacterium]|jgi:hypothetical protein
MSKKNLFEKRGPLYFTGLVLGLAALVAIFQAKRAMMPRFHEMQDERPEVVIAPGGGVRFAYSEEPGYYLIPGLPTGAIISQKSDDGSLKPVIRAGYRDLTENSPLVGPLTEEGKYNLDADFFICAEPGVADCTKLSISQDFRVERDAALGEDRIAIDLIQVAKFGLDSGKNLENMSVKTESAE